MYLEYLQYNNTLNWGGFKEVTLSHHLGNVDKIKSVGTFNQQISDFLLTTYY